jgi:hypothetical protein
MKSNDPKAIAGILHIAVDGDFTTQNQEQASAECM